MEIRASAVMFDTQEGFFGRRCADEGDGHSPLSHLVAPFFGGGAGGG